MIVLATGPPIFTPYYAIIKWVMIIEMILVFLVGMFGILLQGMLAKRKKRSERLQHDVTIYFRNMVEERRSFKRAKLPAQFKNISAILAAILALDREVGTKPAWQQIRDEIGMQYLLPKARRLIKRPRWTNKLKALRCFSFFSEPQDEKAIFKLLDHKIPVVRYAAAHAAAHIGTENALKELIDMMSRSTRFLRHPIHDALMKAGEKTFAYVEKRLETETNAYARLSCIEMAWERMNDHLVSLIEKDLHAEHKNLRIGAIRAFGHYKSRRSIELLLPLLHDAEWEIRALSARSLGYLEATEAAEELVKLCSDKVWWVRMNAALALKRLGNEGKSRLEGLQPDADRFAYETAQYVLRLGE